MITARNPNSSESFWTASLTCSMEYGESGHTTNSGPVCPQLLPLGLGSNHVQADATGSPTHATFSKSMWSPVGRVDWRSNNSLHTRLRRGLASLYSHLSQNRMIVGG